MESYVILLRGVMPRGRNKVLMAPLRAALEEAGLHNVRSYIQSGNVLADSDLSRPEIENLVHEVIANTAGGDIAVIARAADEFCEILPQIPFPGADSSCLYFSLLSVEPDTTLLDEFRAIDSSPEKIQVAGDVLYALYAKAGSSSKFNNNYFERKLDVTATSRNYNTIAKLTELCAARP
jgi:uncharacterized protein (DUF1697 family)